MDGKSNFHTQKGYELASSSGITAAMEDYLEMICRMSAPDGYTRVTALSERLNVRPSSVTKMVDHLKELGYVVSEKYGCITPTEKGRDLGNYLLRRHDLLNRFLCYVNQTEDELELAERIEHFLDERTVRNLERLLEREKSWRND